MQIQKQVILLIKQVLHQNTDFVDFSSASEKELLELFRYAMKQGVFMFLNEYPYLQRAIKQKGFEKQVQLGMYMLMLQMNEAKVLLNAFEANGIACIPLKGSRSRELYPKPELRSMGDIDILYRPEQTKRLQRVMDKLGYQYGGNTAKHDHYDKGRITVEMHKALCSPEWKEWKYFYEIWERVERRENYCHVFDMTPEDHYLFTFTHLLEHFRMGGIGIRMVLDMYVLSQSSELDTRYIEYVLEELDYKEFHDNIIRLANVWFGTRKEPGETPETLKELEDYILNGGVFGKQENDLVNIRMNYKNKLHFFLKATFPSYPTMKTVYSWLKTPIFLPIAWTIRGGQVLTKRRGNLKLQMRRADGFKKDDRILVERRELFVKYGLISRQSK